MAVGHHPDAIVWTRLRYCQLGRHGRYRLLRLSGSNRTHPCVVIFINSLSVGLRRAYSFLFFTVYIENMRSMYLIDISGCPHPSSSCPHSPIAFPTRRQILYSYFVANVGLQNQISLDVVAILPVNLTTTSSQVSNKGPDGQYLRQTGSP